MFSSFIFQCHYIIYKWLLSNEIVLFNKKQRSKLTKNIYIYANYSSLVHQSRWIYFVVAAVVMDNDNSQLFFIVDGSKKRSIFSFLFPPDINLWKNWAKKKHKRNRTEEKKRRRRTDIIVHRQSSRYTYIRKQKGQMNNHFCNVMYKIVFFYPSLYCLSNGIRTEENTLSSLPRH